MSNNTNVLSEGMEITGTIKFSNDMIIDGKVEGEIHSETGTVTIGENAFIKGNIKAGKVKMFGKVEGSVEADACELKASSKLKGDLKAKAMTTEEGAVVDGRMQTG
jgi:cytoskeletal protein CcmA (bactofilin family)